MLRLHNLTLGYGDHTVIRDFSLQLRPGDRVAIMGSSGCGKTTLLRGVLGLEKPRSGSVENSFQKTAAVFQEPRLLPWRTALENVNLVLGDRKETLPTAGEYLAQVELSDAAGLCPDQLSGGMQQRTAIARALAVQADLLVLDEPFRGLDEALKQRISRLVDQNAPTLLLVTHDRKEAQMLGCRILQL